eukprot:4079506-Pleurochrysis_carterae.AAC.1
MSPAGRDAPPSVPGGAVGCGPALLGSALRALTLVRFPSRASGCGSRRSPGRASRARRDTSSGSRFRVEAKGAGVSRAAATAALTSPASSAPSTSLPPGSRLNPP